MKFVKPALDLNLVESFLKEQLGSKVEHLVAVDEGQIARTFRFSFGAGEWFVQFNEFNMAQGPKTELYFREHFRERGIPTREITKTGTWNDLAFVISRRALGQGLEQLTSADFSKVLPSVVEVLLNLATVNVDASSNYGWFDGQFNGKFASWSEHLRFVGQEEGDADFFGRWHGLFDTTFLDRARFEQYFAQMDCLLADTSAERKLIHGGYGYGNILAKDGKVIAVIDWQDARYGDPLFDLAYLIFWQNEEASRLCVAEYCRQSNKRGIHYDNFSNRVRCYHTYIGLDAMRFAAKIDNEELYRLACAILERPWEVVVGA